MKQSRGHSIRQFLLRHESTLFPVSNEEMSMVSGN